MADIELTPGQTALNGTSPAPSSNGQPANHNIAVVASLQTADSSTSSSSTAPTSIAQANASRPGWTGMRTGVLITSIATIFAAAALLLQYQGNVINKKMFDEQVWKDCRDREDMRLLDVCLHWNPHPFHALQLREDEQSMQASGLRQITCSSITLLVALLGNPERDNLLLSESHATTSAKLAPPIQTLAMETIRRASWSDVLEMLCTNAFLGLVLIHLMILLPLRDLRRQHRIIDPHESFEFWARMAMIQESRPAVAIVLTLPFCIFMLLLSSSPWLWTGLWDDLACGGLLFTLLILFCIAEPLMQQMRGKPIERKYPRSMLYLWWLLLTGRMYD